jgi:hypothetical protein
VLLLAVAEEQLLESTTSSTSLSKEHLGRSRALLLCLSFQFQVAPASPVLLSLSVFNLLQLDNSNMILHSQGVIILPLATATTTTPTT